MRVGFIGLGHAGYPMAANLLAAGFEVAVHDLERAKAEHLLDQGATWAGSTVEATRGADGEEDARSAWTRSGREVVEDETHGCSFTRSLDPASVASGAD